MNRGGQRRRHISLASIAVSTLCVALTGCAGHQQSVIDPGGPQADRIAHLFWFFTLLLAAIFIVVMALTLWALVTLKHPADLKLLQADYVPSPPTEKKLSRVVTGATVATVLILFVLLFSSVFTGKAIADLGQTKRGMVIELTGSQWWWQAQYDNPDSSRILVTANEIHIPVGRPVMIMGRSHDVIHSFWVPGLHGKRDLIPSRVTTEWIQADKPGAYRGQCAEFCGLQHAHMAIWVIAEPEAVFDQWMERQLQPASAPTDPVLLHGQQVFLKNECVFCHAIRGTTAAGQVAPDLTHFGSRRGIAANTLPNTRGNLTGWIVDPQSVKPGNHMATIAVNPEDLQPLAEYLESLK